MIHFLYTPFTGLGIRNGYRGDEWLKNRIKVFNSFVLPSLMNQSKREFVLWVSWRPEERNSEIVRQFKSTLDGMRGLTTVFTYGGVCFWDDKKVEDNLLERLTLNLPDLVSYVGDEEEVLMTIQPSDDMYMHDVVEMVQTKFPSNADAIVFDQGYIMNYSTKEIAEYNPTTTPPFSTIKFKKDVFLNPKAHFDFIGPYKSHEYLADKLRVVHSPYRAFVVGTHGENISTVFNHPYKGRTLNNDESDRVYLSTGIYFVEPVIIKRNTRNLARTVFNKLPFQKSLRDFYHRLPAKYQKL